VRVSFKTSARDANLIVARPLAEGQELPPGTREALLVLVDPGEAVAGSPGHGGP
jgi:hypothetical protein